jgi:hypothetical protein
MDFNPGLAQHAPTDKGGENTIENPNRVINLAWQTRAAAPTAAESALADALQAIFADEIYELPQIVERLNRAHLKPPGDAPSWTEESFRAELQRLGV